MVAAPAGIGRLGLVGIQARVTSMTVRPRLCGAKALWRQGIIRRHEPAPPHDGGIFRRRRA
jgi:hypothetical protein